jgi:hypothetical protein
MSKRESNLACLSTSKTFGYVKYLEARRELILYIALPTQDLYLQNFKNGPNKLECCINISSKGLQRKNAQA